MFMKKYRALVGKIWLILTALFAYNAFATAQTPYDLTLEVSDKLFKRVAASQQKIQQNPDYLKTIVREELMPYVHVKYSASKILGRNFSTTTPEQREPFFAVFEKYIEQQYAQILTLYTDQKLDIEKPRTAPDDKTAQVNIKIIQSGKQPVIHLVFYWYKNSKSGKWQVFDMASEGASMVDTKQKEWSPIIVKQGLETLTKRLEQDAKQPIKLSQ